MCLDVPFPVCYILPRLRWLSLGLWHRVKVCVLKGFIHKGIDSLPVSMPPSLSPSDQHLASKLPHARRKNNILSHSCSRRGRREGELSQNSCYYQPKWPMPAKTALASSCPSLLRKEEVTDQSGIRDWKKDALAPNLLHHRGGRDYWSLKGAS